MNLMKIFKTCTSFCLGFLASLQIFAAEVVRPAGSLGTVEKKSKVRVCSIEPVKPQYGPEASNKLKNYKSSLNTEENLLVESFSLPGAGDVQLTTGGCVAFKKILSFKMDRPENEKFVRQFWFKMVKVYLAALPPSDAGVDSLKKTLDEALTTHYKTLEKSEVITDTHADTLNTIDQKAKTSVTLKVEYGKWTTASWQVEGLEVP